MTAAGEAGTAAGAQDGTRAGGSTGIDRLAAAMLIAAVAISPAGIAAASVAFSHPLLLGSG
ncbi:MAG: hypothetical protein WB800_37105, partial [Streptosporangiaceae bacterium]